MQERQMVTASNLINLPNELVKLLAEQRLAIRKQPLLKTKNDKKLWRAMVN